MALLRTTADSSDIECTGVEYRQPSDVPRAKQCMTIMDYFHKETKLLSTLVADSSNYFDTDFNFNNYSLIIGGNSARRK